MIETEYTPAFPVSRNARKKLGLSDDNYDSRGHLKILSRKAAREIAVLYEEMNPGSEASPSDIFGAAYIVTAWRLLLEQYTEGSDPYEKGVLDGVENPDPVLVEIAKEYPCDDIWHGRLTPGEALAADKEALSGREEIVNRWTLAALAAGDPAFSPFRELFTDSENEVISEITELWDTIESSDSLRTPREPEDAPPLATLRKPILAAPNSVKDQLLYILTRWGSLLGDWAAGLVGALDMIEEETRPRGFGGPGPVQRPGFSELDETARFSNDDEWMPQVVLLAKNVLVWLNQLSKKYARGIHTLDAVPDEELDLLASRGFNALWLIGLWERSNSSREIKRRMGNPEAAASAYSLYGYDIAEELGGWGALENLRGRAADRGIRLSSDMVPNHVGLDSDWVRNHPERLLTARDCPYPSYGFNSDNLSEDESVDIKLEDHYWDRSDAAVVFRRVDNRTGDTKFIYHGNDGTTMPWNDTAQIDFLNPEAREAVIQDILHVARNFSIIRFDAAMVLARKHIRRLWYPAPGSGGAIPSRSEYAMSDDEFMAAIPEEFWREVVDRVASEVPGTLLLAEAFWMMEGYFVRALGMHRVYNSAFMNMLRDQKNSEYRDIIKETLAFDPGILQRFVNFMNNPDEETAVEQFGNDDRYFASCTLLATLPGLPMFGHGQIEGLSEKYGMEYVRAYKEEEADEKLIGRHEREIFPILAHRAMFAGAAFFRLYDLKADQGVNENVFVYSNTDGIRRSLVIVNNSMERAAGSINQSSPFNLGDQNILNENLYPALGFSGEQTDCWLLMRELVAGLWYLRPMSEIKDRGLEIIIDGYGRQVFMDFRVEEESSDGIWGRLAAELAGCGTPDPDAAAQEIRLRPLRNALGAIVSTELLNNIAGEIKRGRTPRWPKTGPGSEGLPGRLEIFARLHREFNGGSQTSDISPSDTLKLISDRLRGSARLRRLIGGGVRRQLGRRFPAGDWDESLFLASWSILDSLAKMVSAENCGNWGLENILDENLTEPMKTAHSAGFWLRKSSNPGTALADLMSKPEVREICGVNSWDGVLWYNGERWNTAVRSLILSAAADRESGAPGRRRIRALKLFLKKWYRAGKKADYHVDRLLGAAR